MGKVCALLLCVCFLVAFVSVDNVAHAEKEGSKGKIGIYELKTGNFSMKLTNWGATIMSFITPARDGTPTDIVLGYDEPESYMDDTTYFGSIVGRVANRIKGAKFELNGKEYSLSPNEKKKTTLHGGYTGLSDIVWDVAKHDKKGSNPSIVFTATSVDGDEGFPGAVSFNVTYQLLELEGLSVSMKATMAKNKHNVPTPISLAQHTYWNLGGHNSRNILAEKIRIYASKYTPVDDDLIPTGKIVPVKNTPYDFTRPRTINSGYDQLKKGYDINYALDPPNDVEKLGIAAMVMDVKTLLKMELWTNAPGLQFYTAQNLNPPVKGKDGFMYEAHAGLCLESQWYPDYVHHPNFPQSILKPGGKYEHNMLFRFSYAEKRDFEDDD